MVTVENIQGIFFLSFIMPYILYPGPSNSVIPTAVILYHLVYFLPLLMHVIFYLMTKYPEGFSCLGLG